MGTRDGVGGSDGGDWISCARCDAQLPPGSQFCPDCGTATAPGRPSGPVLPGYTILRPLGRGGAATVYLARQDSLDRDVAVKVLRRDVEEPKVWAQFNREARTIARLSGHPNVVTVYTTGRSDAGQPFLVTEFLDRGSLSDVIDAEGPIPPAAAVRVGVAVADALSAAHGLGILHRDVKPGNVLVDHDGHVKLGDFGIARLLAGRSITTTDVVAFTPEHVAPEILRGERDGPWSDLYGLASTLATALVGAPLFTRRPDERVEALLSRKIIERPPPLPPTVPNQLAALVGRGLDPDPTQRPSVPEFREQLAAMADTLGEARLPLPATEPGTTQPIAPIPPAGDADDADDADDGPARPLVGPLGRRRGPLAAAAALALAVVAAAAVMLARDDDGDASSTQTVATAASSVVASTVPAASPATEAPVVTADPAPAVVTAPPPAATVAMTVQDPPITVAATEPPPPATDPPTTATTTPPTTPPTTATTTPPTTATTTTPPTDAAPLPAPAPEAGAAEAATAREAEAFLRSYFDTVDDGDYETTWAQLAPEFQRGKARSYEYYVGFWDDNDLDVDSVELVDTNPERTIVDADVRWNDSSTVLTERFVLRPDGAGRLLIAGQETVERG